MGVKKKEKGARVDRRRGAEKRGGLVRLGGGDEVGVDQGQAGDQETIGTGQETENQEIAGLETGQEIESLGMIDLETGREKDQETEGERGEGAENEVITGIHCKTKGSFVLSTY